MAYSIFYTYIKYILSKHQVDRFGSFGLYNASSILSVRQMQFKLSIEIDKSGLLSVRKSLDSLFSLNKLEYLYPCDNHLTSKF